MDKIVLRACDAICIRRPGARSLAVALALTQDGRRWHRRSAPFRTPESPHIPAPTKDTQNSETAQAAGTEAPAEGRGLGPPCPSSRRHAGLRQLPQPPHQAHPPRASTCRCGRARFTVEPDGTMSNFEAIKSNSPEAASAVIDALRKVAVLRKPGTTGGKAVAACRWSCPLNSRPSAPTLSTPPRPPSSSTAAKPTSRARRHPRRPHRSHRRSKNDPAYPRAASTYASANRHKPLIRGAVVIHRPVFSPA